MFEEHQKLLAEAVKGQEEASFIRTIKKRYTKYWKKLGAIYSKEAKLGEGDQVSNDQVDMQHKKEVLEHQLEELTFFSSEYLSTTAEKPAKKEEAPVEEAQPQIDVKGERKQAFEEGVAEGKDKGFANGKKEGLEEGHSLGFAEGEAEGTRKAEVEHQAQMQLKPEPLKQNDDCKNLAAFFAFSNLCYRGMTVVPPLVVGNYMDNDQFYALRNLFNTLTQYTVEPGRHYNYAEMTEGIHEILKNLISRSNLICGNNNVTYNDLVETLDRQLNEGELSKSNFEPMPLPVQGYGFHPPPIGTQKPMTSYPNPPPKNQTISAEMLERQVEPPQSLVEEHVEDKTKEREESLDKEEGPHRPPTTPANKTTSKPATTEPVKEEPNWNDPSEDEDEGSDPQEKIDSPHAKRKDGEGEVKKPEETEPKADETGPEEKVEKKEHNVQNQNN